MVTTISTNTFIKDIVIFLRDFLQSNITDPLGASRPSGQKLVYTSYPTKSVTYPIITVKNINIEDTGRLGMQSEVRQAMMTIELRIWARNTKERDEMSQEIINDLRTNEFPASTSGTSTFAGMHDFKLLSAIEIDEDKVGEETVKSKIIEIQYFLILTP